MLKSRHIISLNEKKREKYLRISESSWWDSVTPRLLTENKKNAKFCFCDKIVKKIGKK